jgi:hypothetical protein
LPEVTDSTIETSEASPQLANRLNHLLLKKQISLLLPNQCDINSDVASDYESERKINDEEEQLVIFEPEVVVKSQCIKSLKYRLQKV